MCASPINFTPHSACTASSGIIAQPITALPAPISCTNIRQYLLSCMQLKHFTLLLLLLCCRASSSTQRKWPDVYWEALGALSEGKEVEVPRPHPKLSMQDMARIAKSGPRFADVVLEHAERTNEVCACKSEQHRLLFIMWHVKPCSCGMLNVSGQEDACRCKCEPGCVQLGRWAGCGKGASMWG